MKFWERLTENIAPSSTFMWQVVGIPTLGGVFFSCNLFIEMSRMSWNGTRLKLRILNILRVLSMLKLLPIDTKPGHNVCLKKIKHVFRESTIISKNTANLRFSFFLEFCVFSPWVFSNGHKSLYYYAMKIMWCVSILHAEIH